MTLFGTRRNQNWISAVNTHAIVLNINYSSPVQKKILKNIKVSSITSVYRIGFGSACISQYTFNAYIKRYAKTSVTSFNLANWYPTRFRRYLRNRTPCDVQWSIADYRDFYSRLSGRFTTSLGSFILANDHFSCPGRRTNQNAALE